MLFLVLADLFAPRAAAVVFVTLVRKKNWPAWIACATALAVYVAWANLVARAAGYSLSIYILVTVSLGVGRVLGPPGEQDRETLFLWYPLFGLVLVPTVVLWTISVGADAWRRRQDRVT
jgi:hypothetical protein